VSTHSFDVAVHMPVAGIFYANDPERSTGGAELQTYFLSRALARAGLRVCHVVEERVELPAEVDGVRLVPQRTDPEANVVRYTRDVVSALRACDAGVYVQRCAGYETGVVAAAAKASRRAFVFSSSSNADFDPAATLQRRNRAAFRLGLKLADEVVVQSAEQVDLARRFGHAAHAVPSICEPADRPPGERTAFLWIGGTIWYKDPLAYVKLAQMVPEATFWMVASPREGTEALADELRAAASEVDNIVLLPRRPRAEILELYKHAVAVVNTSRFEGFPNTFLEGWAAGAPALSLNVDPGEVIGRHELGSVANGSLENLAASARDLWQRRGTDDAGNERVQRYVRERHAPEMVAERWIEVLDPLLARSGHRAGRGSRGSLADGVGVG
jgi:glycosyltransferase involved in cell wall biosynthesis